MKKLILFAIIALFTFGAQAQSNVDEIDFTQSVYGLQKRDLIAKHLKLAPNQINLFWQLYDEYEISRKEIALKRMKNIEYYAVKYDSLSELDADALMKTSFEVNTEFLKLWEKRIKLFQSQFHRLRQPSLYKPKCFSKI